MVFNNKLAIETKDLLAKHFITDFRISEGVWRMENWTSKAKILV